MWSQKKSSGKNSNTSKSPEIVSYGTQRVRQLNPGSLGFRSLPRRREGVVIFGRAMCIPEERELDDLCFAHPGRIRGRESFS